MDRYFTPSAPSGLFHGSGFNSLGLQLSGGAGDQLATWVALGRPELPLDKYDIRRFTQVHRQDRAWITETSQEAFAKSYSINYPNDQPLAGRNHRIGAFHEVIKQFLCTLVYVDYLFI